LWQARAAKQPDDDIWGLLLASTGMPVGGEFMVNSTTYYPQEIPAVAVLPNGKVVATWGTEGPYPKLSDVLFSIMDCCDGSFSSDKIANINTEGSQLSNSIVVFAGSEFIIPWQSSVVEGGQEKSGVYLRRFDLNGTPKYK